MTQTHYWIIVGVFPNGEEVEMPVQWRTRQEAERIVEVTSQFTPPSMHTEIREFKRH